MVEPYGDTFDDCGRHVQDWRGLAYVVERNRWVYLCPDCAEEREYLDDRAIDDVECPSCRSVQDVERVGLHDILLLVYLPAAGGDPRSLTCLNLVP